VTPGTRVGPYEIVAPIGAGGPPPFAENFVGELRRDRAEANMRTQVSDEAPPVFDRVVRLVSTAAHEYAPAISPDGKWVAYLSNARGGTTDVWVKFIAGGDPANLTANADIAVQSTDYINGLRRCRGCRGHTQLVAGWAPTRLCHANR
jgi:WD40-like Beta Propeller Repeat